MSSRKNRTPLDGCTPLQIKSCRPPKISWTSSRGGYGGKHRCNAYLYPRQKYIILRGTDIDFWRPPHKSPKGLKPPSNPDQKERNRLSMVLQDNKILFNLVFSGIDVCTNAVPETSRNYQKVSESRVIQFYFRWPAQDCLIILSTFILYGLVVVH